MQLKGLIHYYLVKSPKQAINYSNLFMVCS